jgi:Serine dehydratase alpha chain
LPRSTPFSRLALRGDGRHFVSLDKAIKTMRDTGRDMLDRYKGPRGGGLAVTSSSAERLSLAVTASSSAPRFPFLSFCLLFLIH